MLMHSTALLPNGSMPRVNRACGMSIKPTHIRTTHKVRV